MRNDRPLSSSPILGLAEAKLSIKNSDFSSFKLIINEFFIADLLNTFIHSLHQKRAISEREKLIKEGNVNILWSNS